ncbi:MAG: YihY/virulence factor BrkB family protein [Mariniphaga sp.]|nr:YihY/virulence factor BrkB family protein [Mariniphaga sp.]
MKNFSFAKARLLLKTVFKKWWNRDPFNESAIIAYNAIFSLPGLLVVVIAIAGYFLGGDAVSGKLHSEIAQAMGNDTADQVQSMVMFASQSKDSVWATIMGIAIILVGATGVFVHLQKSLNTIWEVKASTTKSGIWSFIKTRIFSFGLIVSIAFLLLISLVVSSLLSAFSSWVLLHWSGSLLIIFEILNVVFSLAIITVLFAMMFKFLPDAKIKWRSVWIGAFVTSLLFVLGKSALGLYFGKADPGSGYGAAGSIILILLWTSYSSMIVFFGAEFTKVYSDNLYGQIPASENGVKEKNSVANKRQKKGEKKK